MIKPTIIALSLIAFPAAAQVPCAPTEAMLDNLKQRYQEEPQALGLAFDGTLTQVYANTDKGTYSIVATRPDGLSCLLISGDNFQILPKPKGPKV